jgi:hypothetical protein
MTPERWQTVDKLFEQALDKEPDDRCAFLDEACADDDELQEFEFRRSKVRICIDKPAAWKAL